MNVFDQIVSKPQQMDRQTFERLPVCWLTEFVDWGRSGAVADAHIVDQCLLPKGDPRRYDPSYRLNLRVDIHALFDARTITILPNGSISTTLSDGQLTSLGLDRQSRLHPVVLTEKRVQALKERIVDRDQFVVAKALAMQSESNVRSKQNLSISKEDTKPLQNTLA